MMDHGPGARGPGSSGEGDKGRTERWTAWTPTASGTHPPEVLRTPGTTGETGAEVERLCDAACLGPWNNRAMREWMKQNQRTLLGRKGIHTYIG